MQGVNSRMLLHSGHLDGWFVQILQPIKPYVKLLPENIPHLSTLATIQLFH